MEVTSPRLCIYAPEAAPAALVILWNEGPGESCSGRAKASLIYEYYTFNTRCRSVFTQMIENQVKELKKLWGNKRQFLFQVRRLARARHCIRCGHTSAGVLELSLSLCICIFMYVCLTFNLNRR